MKHSVISSFKSLKSGEDEFLARLKIINEAKSFLYCSVYFCQHDKYGEKFFAALIQAAKRGIYVCLIIDSFGQFLTKTLMAKNEEKKLKEKLDKIKIFGGDVIFYRVKKNPIKRLSGAGYHIKIQLSDQGQAIFGSSNISATSFEKWQEYSALLTGEIVSVLMADLLYLLPKKAWKHLNFLEKNNKNSNRKYHCQYISFDPNKKIHILFPLTRQKNDLTDFLQKKIRQAKDRIDISSFYFKPESQTLKLLLDAAKRKVLVNIYHSGPNALPTNIAWLPSLKIYKKLLKNGVNIYENLNGEHSKIVIIDDKMSAFGSYNFEYAAHDLLAESMIYTEESLIVNELRNYLKNLLQKYCVKVTQRTVKDLPFSIKFKIFFLSPFLRFF